MSLGRRTIDASTAALQWLRDRERLAIGVGTIVGLMLAQSHYLGLVVGGLLVGLPARSTKRALGFGLAFGLIVWLTFGSWLLLNGVLEKYAGMGELALLSVGVSLVLPTLGAVAVRGLTK